MSTFDPDPAPSSRVWRRLPAGIWALGLVSLLMDVSSEMIHALLPVYLVAGLGASVLAVGIIEGIAEATAAITKVFSGALSDRIGRRKGLALAGYGLAAVTKPVFALAGSVGWVVAARFVDRMGKGIRGAPRDALVAEISPPGLRGASFGLRQSLDTVGAFAGPLLAIALMWAFAGDFIAAFWVAVIPAVLSVAVLLLAVHEPDRPADLRKVRNPLSRAEMRHLPRAYWITVALAFLFTLARFSEAFLILRADSLGLSVALVPAVLVVLNLAYAMSAYPAGALSDRMDRTTVLLVGLVVLVAADLVLAATAGLAGLFAGVALWGLHMGLTQGILATLVADAAPAELRGTAFGVFNLVTGVALLLASALAGALWEGVGPQATFLAGACLAAATAAGLVALRRPHARP
jgi:MFS family permease